MEEQLADFLAQRESRLLSVLTTLDAGGAPSREDLAATLANREDFTRLRACYESHDVHDPLLRRQAAVLYRLFLPHQVESALADGIRSLAARSAAVREQARADLGAGPVPYSALWGALESDKSQPRRAEAWSRLGAIAETIAPLLLEAVALRNRAARDLGFPDHFELQLFLHEVDPESAGALIDDLRRATDEAHAAFREELRRERAREFHLRKSSLKAWHFADPVLLARPLDWDADAGPDPKAAALACAYLKGFDLDTGATRAVSGKGRGDDAFERLAGLAIALPGVLRDVSRRSANSHLPPVLRRVSHPILIEAASRLYADEISHSAAMPGVLGISSQKAVAIRARLRRRRAADRIIHARFAVAAWGFVRQLYRHPGEDLASRWATCMTEILGPEVEAIPSGWALVPALFDDRIPWLTKAFGAASAVQVAESLPAPNRAGGLLSDPDNAKLVRHQMLEGGDARSWADTIAHVSSRPLEIRRLPRRIGD